MDCTVVAPMAMARLIHRAIVIAARRTLVPPRDTGHNREGMESTRRLKSVHLGRLGHIGAAHNEFNTSHDAKAETRGCFVAGPTLGLKAKATFTGLARCTDTEQLKYVGHLCFLG